MSPISTQVAFQISAADFHCPHHRKPLTTASSDTAIILSFKKTDQNPLIPLFRPGIDRLLRQVPHARRLDVICLASSNMAQRRIPPIVNPSNYALTMVIISFRRQMKRSSKKFHGVQKVSLIGSIPHPFCIEWSGS